MALKTTVNLAIIASSLLFANTANAQGQDGTRAQRNAQIMSEILPGIYDNANQAYFDKRLKEPEGRVHPRRNLTIERTSNTDLGEFVFIATNTTAPATEASAAIYTLDGNESPYFVRMKVYKELTNTMDGKTIKNLSYAEGCDVIWREEAGQYHGTQESDTCQLSDVVAHDMLLSEDALWVKGATDEMPHFTLERARPFSCYIDVPGVGGGRDIPFKRHEIPTIHDKGGKAQIELDDGSTLTLSLQNIRWPMNNEKGIFTRHSFVMYINQKPVDGEDKEIAYTWTIPQAPRIGVNLKWMLANCYQLSNEDVTPYFKNEPLLNLNDVNSK